MVGHVCLGTDTVRYKFCPQIQITIHLGPKSRLRMSLNCLFRHHDLQLNVFFKARCEDRCHFDVK